MSVKINTEDIVSQTETLMGYLDQMEKTTSKLYYMASDYNERIQDGVMGDMVNLLDEIGRHIDDIKKKTYKFTKAKQDGAEMMDQIMKRNSSKVKKI